MSQIVQGPNNAEYAVCPYNSTHLVAPHRLAQHVGRCALNYPRSTLARCPCDSSHFFPVADKKKHAKSCPNCIKMIDIMKPNKMPPPKAPEYFVESAENWDEEPPAPTYNPQKYCESSFAIRNPQGLTPAARRQFREKERRRFFDKDD